MSNSGPIGIFDSGVGGLSVLNKIRLKLPNENIIYVADSAHLPYGTKQAGYVVDRSVKITEFLLNKGAKAIVVACNTATAAAVSTLRALHRIPIIGVEPGLKPAIEHTQTGVVGVLATNGTLGSVKFSELVGRFAGNIEVIIQPCPGFVSLVEAGKLSGEETFALVKSYIEPLKKRFADTLVLGCTHFPFLTSIIQDVAGTDVRIIDTSCAIAQQLRRRLQEENLTTESAKAGNISFWTSGQVDQLTTVISRLWNEPVELSRLPAKVAETEYAAYPYSYIEMK
jgi:glutamate racemase